MLFSLHTQLVQHICTTRQNSFNCTAREVVTMGNHYRSKTKHKRRRRSAAKQAVSARWKHAAASTSASTSSTSSSMASTSPASTPAPTSGSQGEVQGSRIIDLKYLYEGIQKITEHSKQCDSNCSISEVHREGLASVFEVDVKRSSL